MSGKLAWVIMWTSVAISIYLFLCAMGIATIDETLGYICATVVLILIPIACLIAIYTGLRWKPVVVHPERREQQAD